MPERYGMVKSLARALWQRLKSPDVAKAKNPHAVALGRKGGLKGGKARFAAMTAEERTALAKKAARARWKKRP
jgi:hypothetical protein